MITNIDVHTFHSFAVRYFVSKAFTDGGIRDILLKKIQSRQEIPSYNIIVTDECQDYSIVKIISEKESLVIYDDFGVKRKDIIFRQKNIGPTGETGEIQTKNESSRRSN